MAEAKGNQMKTIGDLLTRDLSRKIEEIIQVDQADEQSVYAVITEYIATDSIREQYQHLLMAIAEAPSDPHESVGVWVSGFFGSGKSSFAKNLGYALENRKVLGTGFADLFKKQVEDTRISNLLDLINVKTPTEVILFEVAKEADTRKVTQRIAELMYTVLLRELGYSEDFDIAELEIERAKRTAAVMALPKKPQSFGPDDATTIEGTLVDVRLKNPHSALIVQIDSAGGSYVTPVRMSLNCSSNE